MRLKWLLIWPTAICSLWAVRCLITHSWQYAFIPPNVYLAVIPLLVERLFPVVKRKWAGLKQRAAQIITAGLWLLFLPNTFYILTDFMHLNADVLIDAKHNQGKYLVHYPRGDGLYVFDSLLVFLATIFGAYVGGLALLHLYRYLDTRMRRRWTICLLGCTLLLTSIGVYIGRYSRWNSWQALFQPWDIVREFIQDIGNQTARGRLAYTVASTIILALLSLAFVWHEQQNTEKKSY